MKKQSLRQVPSSTAVVPTTFVEFTELSMNGVECLRKSLYKEAIQSISKALSFVRVTIDELNLDSTATTGSQQNDCDSSSYIQDKSFIKVAWVSDSKPLDARLCCNLSNAVGGENNDVDWDYICRSPLYIVDSLDDTQRFNEDYYTAYSFVLIYNLALANHLSAATDDVEIIAPATTQRKYETAAFLYKMAYSIHATEEIYVGMIHLMSIINNLAHISSRLRHGKDTNECAQALLSFVMYINSKNSLSSYIRNVSTEDEEEERTHLQIFLENVVPLLLSRTQGSAAAA